MLSTKKNFVPLNFDGEEGVKRGWSEVEILRYCERKKRDEKRKRKRKDGGEG